LKSTIVCILSTDLFKKYNSIESDKEVMFIFPKVSFEYIIKLELSPEKGILFIIPFPFFK
jgi:hypothetical protein